MDNKFKFGCLEFEFSDFASNDHVSTDFIEVKMIGSIGAVTAKSKWERIRINYETNKIKFYKSETDYHPTYVFDYQINIQTT